MPTISDRGHDLSRFTWQSDGRLGQSVWLQFVSHLPGQQFVNASGDVIRNVGQDVFQIGARGDAVDLARPKQTVHCGGPLASAVGAGEQEVFPPKAHAAQSVLSQRVADLGLPVRAEQRQSVPVI